MMITPEDIKKKAERLYSQYLISLITHESFFPQEIKFPKLKSTEDYKILQGAIEALAQGSREYKAYGYTIQWEHRKTQRYGTQSFPEKIFFETEQDFLKFLRKEKEAESFKKDLSTILEKIPQLDSWIQTEDNAKKIIEYRNDWRDLLEVCQFFLRHPAPDCYLRELPVNVHTKFIEEHTGILGSLLNALLPADAIQAEESDFSKRFFLKQDEPFVRFRFLDTHSQEKYGIPFSDLSIPVSQFSKYALPIKKCVITENKMTFLTLPKMENAIGLFGGGFKVGVLKNVSWLNQCELYYWGDLDAQGFQILSQCRSYFPQTESLMMNFQTFNRFKRYVIPGTIARMLSPQHLTQKEQELFEYLCENNERLEQEKIAQNYIIEVFSRLNT